MLPEPSPTSAESLAPRENREISQQLAIRRGHERGFALLAETTQALAAANSFEEIKGLRDKAEAVRAFARAANLNLEFQNKAAELKLRAERKAGQVLQKMKLRGGDRKSNRHRGGLKLADLGLTENQPRRWQREALVPEDEFCRYIASTQERGREITAAGLLKLAAGMQVKADGSARLNTAKSRVKLTAVGMLGDESTIYVLSELPDHLHLLADTLQPGCDGTGQLEPHCRRIVRICLSRSRSCCNISRDPENGRRSCFLRSDSVAPKLNCCQNPSLSG